MPIHPEMDKQKLLELNRVEHDFLRRTVALLTPDQQVSAAIMPGWTVKDMLAHVTVWEQRFIGWVEAAQQGARIDRPSTGYTEAGIDRLNAADHAASKNTLLPEVMAAFERSFFEFQRLLAHLPDEALLTPGAFAFTGGHALWQFAASNGCEHYMEHSAAIRAWLAAQDG